jgi:hypothetical protein
MRENLKDQPIDRKQVVFRNEASREPPITQT